MKVSSPHLALISPVFKAMLQRDNYQKGATLQSEGCVEIQLPDDDPKAFTVMLNILYFRHKSVPDTINLHDLVQITVLIDKYQVVPESVEVYTTKWLSSLQKRMPKSINEELDIQHWICLSWIFHLEHEFATITRLLILESPHNVAPDFVRKIVIPSSIAGSSISLTM